MTGAGALAALGTAVFVFLRTTGSPRAPRPDPSRIKVAAVGDSNTWGAGVIFTGRRATLSYPGQLQKLLGDRYQVLNYGLNGRTLLYTGDRPYSRNKFAAAIAAAAPDIILLMLGTNDSKPHNWNAVSYERELVALIQRYHALPNRPTVYVLTPPVAFPNRMHISPETIREEIVPISVAAAAATGAILIDIYAVTSTAVQAHRDGVHPDGYALGIIARTVHQHLAAVDTG